MTGKRTTHWGWLVAGLAGGYGFAMLQAWWLHPASAPDPSQAANSESHEPTATGSLSPSSATVTVSFENSNTSEFVRTPGILVGPERVLLVSIDAIKNAASGQIEDASGQRLPVGDVIATDMTLGLAALATGFSVGAFHPLSADSGSLFLGREFVAESLNGTRSGFVDSAAQRIEAGHYLYALAATDIAHTGPIALLEAREGKLIGITVPPTSAGARGNSSLQAIDAAAVADLLASRRTSQPMSLTDFATYYVDETDTGRMETLARLVAEGNWPEAIAMGLDMTGNGERQPAVIALMEEAIQAETEQLLAAGQTSSALRRLDEARRALGPGAERMALRAEVHRAMDDSDTALDWYERALREDVTLANRLRPALRDYALALTHRPTTGIDAGIAVLLRVLVADAAFAPYHARLGQLYVQAGRYALADQALSRALQLDPGLSAELQDLVARARQRRALPANVDAPIDTRGSALFVTVRLNGASQPYRFLLDTGASYTAISVATALRLGIDKPFLGAPVVALDTANGRVYAAVTTLKSIAVGDAAVNDVEVVVLDSMNGTDGLLGLSYLNHFNVDINRTLGLLSLSRR